MAEISYPCCSSSGTWCGQVRDKVSKVWFVFIHTPGRGALMKPTHLLPGIPLLLSVPATSPLNSMAVLSTQAASLDCAERFHCSQPARAWASSLPFYFSPSLVYKSFKRKSNIETGWSWHQIPTEIKGTRFYSYYLIKEKEEKGQEGFLTCQGQVSRVCAHILMVCSSWNQLLMTSWHLNKQQHHIAPWIQCWWHLSTNGDRSMRREWSKCCSLVWHYQNRGVDPLLKGYFNSLRSQMHIGILQA